MCIDVYNRGIFDKNLKAVSIVTIVESPLNMSLKMDGQWGEDFRRRLVEFHFAYTVSNYDKNYIPELLGVDNIEEDRLSLMDVTTIYDEAYAALQFVDLHKSWGEDWANRFDKSHKKTVGRKWPQKHRGMFHHQVPDEALAFYSKAVDTFRSIREDDELRASLAMMCNEWWDENGHRYGKRKLRGPAKKKTSPLLLADVPVFDNLFGDDTDGDGVQDDGGGGGCGEGGAVTETAMTPV